MTLVSSGVGELTRPASCCADLDTTAGRRWHPRFFEKGEMQGALLLPPTPAGSFNRSLFEAMVSAQPEIVMPTQEKGQDLKSFSRLRP